MLTNLNLTDMETCYKAIRGDLARSLPVHPLSQAVALRSRRGVSAGMVAAQPNLGVLPLRANRRVTRQPAGRGVAWLIAALAMIVGTIVIDAYPVGTMHDDGLYVILAKSLATGHGYRWLQLPDAPAATHFPPGYPLLLAMLWKLVPSFPANVLVFKLANVVCVAVTAFLLARLMRERWAFSSAWQAAVTLLGVLGIPMLLLSTLVMSEPLFLLLVVLALGLAERVTEGSERRIWMIVALGLLIALSTLVRTHGIALVAAVTLLLFFRGRRRDAIIVLGAAGAVLMPWQIWAATRPASALRDMSGMYQTYTAWLSAGFRTDGIGMLWRTAARTLPDSLRMLGELGGFGRPELRTIGLAVLGGLSVAGLRPLWRRAPVTALFMGLYATILILWPYTPTRFICAVWPLVVLLPALGARDLLAWRPSDTGRRGVRVVLLAGTVLVLAGHASYTALGYQGRWWSIRPRTVAPKLRPLITWVRQATPPDATLALDEESAVYLYTGRHTVPVEAFTVHEFFVPRTPAQDAEVLRQVLGHYAVDAVILAGQPAYAAARVLIASRPPVLAVRDTVADFLILSPVVR